MDILLKCVGVMLLLVWPKENLLIFCTNDTTQRNTGSALSLSDLYGSFPAPDHDNVSSHNIVPRKGVTWQNTPDSVNKDSSSLNSNERQDVSVSDLLYDSLPASDHDNVSSHNIVPRKGVTWQNTPDAVNKDSSSLNSNEGQDVSASDLLYDSFPASDYNVSSHSIVPRKGVTWQNTPDAVNNDSSSLNSDEGQDVSASGVLYDSFPASDYDNVSSHSIVPRKGVTWQNTSDSVNGNSDSLSSTAATTDSTAKLSDQSPSHKYSNIIYVAMAGSVIALAVFLYKKGRVFCKRTYYKQNYRQTDFLNDDYFTI
jgi:hypothetical protein